MAHPDTTPTIAFPPDLALAGAGRMGGALLEGWLEAGLDPRAVRVIEPHPGPALRAFCADRGVALNPAPAAPAGMLVLAVKPQTLPEAAPALAGLVDARTTLVSILAGKTIADLAARFPGAGAIVRAMPNLPASIGRGATGAVAGPGLGAAAHGRAHALLACSGVVEWLDDESLIDAVTALSGSGPAYVALLAEALAQAGIAAGLPSDTATRLARATVTGTGALLDRDPREAGALRVDVTSPGGTTAAALAVLMRPDGLAALVREAVAAAQARARELAG